MIVEQAIFTSVKSERMDGYQVASTSYGVSEADARELVSWGPAHDSLLQTDSLAVSVNFHKLSSGLHAVSRTTAAHAEYSGRGGRQVYTHYLLVTPQVLSRFANNPFRLLEAVRAMGKMHAFRRIPSHLERLELVGAAAPVDATLLAQLNRRPGAAAMTALLRGVIDAAATGQTVGVAAKPPVERVIAGLVNLLPLPCRTDISFGTGLRFSPRRAFRMISLPMAADQQRRLLRVAPIKRVDLTGAGTETLAVRDGWTQEVEALFNKERFEDLRRFVAASTAANLQELCTSC